MQHLQGEIARCARESAAATASGTTQHMSGSVTTALLTADDDDGADTSSLRQMFPMSFGLAPCCSMPRALVLSFSAMMGHRLVCGSSAHDLVCDSSAHGRIIARVTLQDRRRAGKKWGDPENPHTATKRVTVGPQRPKKGMIIAPISMSKTSGAQGGEISNSGGSRPGDATSAAKAAAAAAAAESPGTVHGWHDADRQLSAVQASVPQGRESPAAQEVERRSTESAQLATSSSSTSVAIGPPRPPALRAATNASAGAAVGPSRPPGLAAPKRDSSTDAALIGPPRPANLSAPYSGASDDAPLVGPPQPAQHTSAPLGAVQEPTVGPPRPERLAQPVAGPDAGLMGPPRPPELAKQTRDADTLPLVGPPRPAPNSQPLVGPPRPPGHSSQAVEIAMQHVAVETAAVPDIGKPFGASEVEQRVAAGVSTVALTDDATPRVAPSRPPAGRTPPRMPPPKFSESVGASSAWAHSRMHERFVLRMAAAWQSCVRLRHPRALADGATQSSADDDTLPKRQDNVEREVAIPSDAELSGSLADASKREVEAAQEDASRLPISNEVRSQRPASGELYCRLSCISVPSVT